MYQQMDMFDLLDNADKEILEKYKDVPIQEIITIVSRLSGTYYIKIEGKFAHDCSTLDVMSDYSVSCSYGDVVLIISMLHDYVGWLDRILKGDPVYQAYYRKKFIEIADRLAEQIEYDYDKELEKCRKKKGRNNDIGEDGFTQLAKKRK